MRRKPLNRKRFARKFNRQSARTKAINVAPPIQRGGYRL